MNLYLFRTEVVKIWPLSSIITRLRITAPEDFCRQAAPGRFVMLGCENDLFDPLLKRPFGICSWGRNWFEVIIKMVGKGSRQLGGLKAGDAVAVHGPLGEGYPDIRTDKGKEFSGSLVLVAGGMGIASIASALLPAGQGRGTAQDKILLYGAANVDELILLDEIKNCNPGLRIETVTDDGSSGRQGLVTELLQLELEKQSGALTFACGPEPMLKSVQQVLKNNCTSGFLSLENRMACGFGVCLGCVQTLTDINGKNLKRAKVCTQGPVFPAAEVVF
jgi:dihydroorotate dehydrogenase electron transfer subunit